MDTSCTVANAVRSLLGCAVAELTIERLVVLLAGIRRRSAQSSGHWITTWYDALVDSLRQFLHGHVRSQLLRAGQEVAEAFERWPLALCGPEAQVSSILSSDSAQDRQRCLRIPKQKRFIESIAFSGSRDAFLALWRQLNGTRRLVLLFAHHPRLIMPSCKLTRQTAVLWRGQLALHPHTSTFRAPLRRALRRYAMGEHWLIKPPRKGEEYGDIMLEDTNPSSPRSMPESDGLSLPLCLAPEHVLGSGVTPMPKQLKQDWDMQRSMQRIPSQSANPAHVAKLQGNTLSIQAGTAWAGGQKMIQVAAMTDMTGVACGISKGSPVARPGSVSRFCGQESPERWKVGHSVIFLETRDTSFSGSECWALQILNLEHDPLPDVIEQLSAAGAVLDCAVSEDSEGATFCPEAKDQLGVQLSDERLQLQTLDGLRVKRSMAGVVMKFRPGQAQTNGDARVDPGRELKALAAAQKHPNIAGLCGLYCVSCMPNPFEAGWALLTEHGSNLREELWPSGRGRKTEFETRLLSEQLFSALDHLHGRGRTAVGSFTRFWLPLESESVGTVGYMAPEVIRYEEATFRSDIFSAGVVIYLLFSGEHPFGEEHTAEFTKYQTACVEADVQSGLFESASVAFRRLLEQVLQKDPTERPTAEEALQEPFSTVAVSKCPTHTQTQDEWFGAVGKHVSGKASVPLSTPSRATRSESLNLPEEGKRRSWPLTSILSSSRWRRASALAKASIDQSFN
eukprot:g17045.t1